MHDDDLIHVTVPRHPSDPRSPPETQPGVVVHYVPELHPDDVTVIDGIPVTSLSRTLIDLAEAMPYYELRACWARARTQGQLDLDAVRASRKRVEWRPSLVVVDRLIAEHSA
jgi:hypothetical protein